MEKINGKLLSKIEERYAKHGVIIELETEKGIINGDRLIFPVKLKKSTKASDFLRITEEVQRFLKIPILKPLIDGLDIMLIISMSENPHTVRLISVIKRKEFIEAIRNFSLPIVLGCNYRNEAMLGNLELFPHLKVGGTSMSGKSSYEKAIITTFAAYRSVGQVNLILINTRTSDFDIFNGLPHLSYPVVHDPKTALFVLLKVKEEKKRRMPLENTREFSQFPAIVIVIDEIASLYELPEQERNLMSSTLRDLLQCGRHVKIHFILATHDGTISGVGFKQVGVSTAVAFKCDDMYQSRAIIGKGGAEFLPGNGAMMLKHDAKTRQLQAPYISDDEVRKIVSSIEKKYFLSSLHFPNRKFTILKEDIEAMLAVDETDGLLFNAAGKNALVGNKRLSDIILQVLTRNKISISELQRTLHVGFSKAKALMERLCNIGIAESPESTKPCNVIVRSFGDLTDDAVSLLTKDGYSADDIKAVLDVKCEMIGEDQ